MNTQWPEEYERLVAWLEQNTDSSTRVGIEFDYNRRGMPVLLPLHIERNLIGGPLDGNPLTFSFADIRHRPQRGFERFEHWGKPFFSGQLETMPEDRIRSYLQLYAVRWLCVFSENNKRRLHDLPQIWTFQSRFGDLECGEVAGKADFTLEGTARVSADYRGIEVRNAAPGTLVLSFHYFPSLRCKPPLPLEPVMALDDPEPLIRVRHGDVADFRIVNSYRWDPDPLLQWLLEGRALQRQAFAPQRDYADFPRLTWPPVKTK